MSVFHPDEWVILSSANKHGIVDVDLIHAIDNHLQVWGQDDGLTVLIGPTRAGALLEVGLIEWYGLTAIAHAMPARSKYL